MTYQNTPPTVDQNGNELPQLQRQKRPMETWGPLLFVALIIAAFAFVMFAADAQASRSSQNFVQKASVGNAFEIQSSQLAMQKSQNNDVRNFAQMMIDDHSKTGDQLKSLLASGSVDATAPDENLDKRHQKIMNQLNDASGADFDKKYVKAQDKAHGETISLFNGYSKHGDNGALKDFATQTLPTLQQHQDTVKKLKSSI